MIRDKCGTRKNLRQVCTSKLTVHPKIVIKIAPDNILHLASSAPNIPMQLIIGKQVIPEWQSTNSVRFVLKFFLVGLYFLKFSEFDLLNG